jgi:hypothetical protein
MAFRIFFVNDRLFALIASKSSVPDFNWHAELLGSFRTLTKSEYIAAQIKENTPEALPQAAPESHLPVDLAERDLKGKVRSIVEEEQETPKSAREMSGEVHLDPNGNLTREITYSSGYPSEVAIWGWIDGMRVKAFSLISYPFGEGPNEKEITSIIQAIPTRAPDPPEKPRDRRYDIRYEFRRDAQNRVVERKLFGNNGDLLGTENISYGPNSRTTEFDDDGGKTRSVETLDGNGHVIEERFFGPAGKLERHFQYKYELDAKGNWITRKTFRKKTLKGKSTLQPLSTHFRTIVYYE